MRNSVKTLSNSGTAEACAISSSVNAPSAGFLQQIGRNLLTRWLAGAFAVSAPVALTACPSDDDDSAMEGNWLNCDETPELCNTDGDPLMDDTDCDPQDPTIYAGAPENPYDGIDQDCDGEDLADVDGDGFNSTAVEGGEDCDDGDPEVNPDVLELCDGVDQDCDGEEDESEDLAEDEGETWRLDLNNDGLCSDGEPGVVGCDRPEDVDVELEDGQTITLHYVSCEGK